MDVFFTLFLTCLLGSIVWYSWIYGISPTPTSIKVQNQLLQILPPIKNGYIAELGSGWGSLAFALARRFPECHVEGFEISPIPYLFSKIILKIFSYPNLTFTRCDFFSIPLNHSALIVCYLYPGAMIRLKSKFEKELSPDCYVLSHTFAVPGWNPICQRVAPDLYRTPIYLYKRSTCLSTGLIA